MLRGDGVESEGGAKDSVGMAAWRLQASLISPQIVTSNIGDAAPSLARLDFWRRKTEDC